MDTQHVAREGGVPDVLADRWTRLADFMQRRGLECIAAVGQRYATWLTGYHRYFGGLSATLIRSDDGIAIVVSPDEVPLALSDGVADVRPFGDSGFGLQLDTLGRLVRTISDSPELQRADGLGIAALDPSLLGRGAEQDVTEALDEISRVKDGDELSKLAHAYSMCWRAQAAVEESTRSGASEIEMFSAAQSAAQNSHGSPVDFVADVLVGKRTADVCCPVAVAGGERWSGAGDWVVSDIAVGAAGYWGDTCQTHLGPDCPSDVREARAKLEELRSSMAAQLRPGAIASHIYGKIREQLLESFPGASFPHHAGHGVGLSGFEYPHLVPADDSVLSEGMVLALEPGVYFRGRWGARVEQLFMVTEAGGIELGQWLSSRSEIRKQG